VSIFEPCRTAQASNRFLLVATIWSGNAANGHADVGTAQVERAIGHFLYDLFTDSPVVDEHLGLQPQHRFLGAVGVADNPVGKTRRTPGDIGYRLRDPAARTGFGGRHRFACIGECIDQRLWANS